MNLKSTYKIILIHILSLANPLSELMTSGPPDLAQELSKIVCRRGRARPQGVFQRLQINPLFDLDIS